MRTIFIALALTAAACGSSPSAPTAPAPTPAPTPTPPVVSMIESSPCPPAIVGFSVDLHFYTEIGCNTFDGPQSPVRRWLQAPRLYVLTVDDAGAPIDAVTLDTVTAAMVAAAPMLTSGRFSLATVDRGTDMRQVGLRGVISVSWLSSSPAAICGQARIAGESGLIELNYTRPTCACDGSRIYRRAAAHELGHALGYYHTDAQSDLMFGSTPATCDAGLSAREQQAVAYHYR